MNFRADLHCHSTCSDGTFSPENIIQLASDIGLSAISITDHDTIDAYTTAAPKAKEMGIDLISGAEFSSVLGDHSVHILAYAFPLNSQIIKDFCLKHHERRVERNKMILQLLEQHSMPISEQDVYDVLSLDTPFDHRSIGRPHIAQAMLKKGYIESITEGFQKYLAEGKSCYAQGASFSAQETIDVIHEAKGLAVIAHPHLINHSPTLQELLKMNFDGIECYYAKFPKGSEKRWIKLAEYRNWLITGGSDFHGAIKPQIPFGASWVDEERFNKLKTHFVQASS